MVIAWDMHASTSLPYLGSVPIFLFGDKNSLAVRLDWVIFFCMVVQLLQSRMGVHWLSLGRVSGGVWRVA